jgi:hypothetical protein
MRPCPSCGQQIQKSSLFCGTCGAKVPPESLPTKQQASVKIHDGHVDPLASTAPASMSPAAELLKRAKAAGAPASAARVSPKAETGVQASPEPPRGAPPAAAPPAASAPPKGRSKTAPLSAMKNPPVVARAPSANPPTPSSPLTPGARVLVQWANGQRYGGVIERVTGPQCLIRFDAGEQRWVESRFVLPAK